MKSSSSSITLLLCCLSLALLWSCSAKEVYLNSTALAACTNGDNACWFLDPSVWVNEAAPEADDAVYIQDNVEYIYMYLNQSINLTSLTFANDIEFKFVGNAAVNVQNVSLLGTAIVYFQDNAQIISNYRTYLGNQSQLIMLGGAYAQDGESFVMERGSSFTIIGGYLGMHANVVHIRGDLNLSPVTAMFVSSSPVLYFENLASLTFPFTPIIYNAYYINSSVTFNSGLRSSAFSYLQSSNVTFKSTLPSNTMNNITVDATSNFYVRGVSGFNIAYPNITGNFVISSSSVVVTQPPEFSTSSLTLAGKASLKSSFLVIRSLQYAVGENNEPISVTILCDNLHIFGDVYAPSTDIYATQLAFFQGNMVIDGAVTVGEVAIVQYSNLTVDTLTLGYDNTGRLIYNESEFEISYTSFTANHIRIGDNGTLDASFSQVKSDIILHVNSTLEHENSTFTGHIFNGGFITVHHMLSIDGNYTQWGHGNLLSHLDLSNRSSGHLSVSGYAFLNGSLQYRIDHARVGSARMQLPVIQTGSGVSGKFYEQLENTGELIDDTNKIEYSEHDVYLSFGPPTKKNAADLWWVWLIVVIGIIAVVGLIVIVVKTVRRKDYRPVE